VIALAALAMAQGLFDRLIPHPTGADGHEEYVRAAEFVEKSEELGRRYSQLAPGAASLQELKHLSHQYGPAAMLVRQGNRKPYLPIWSSGAQRNLDDLQPLRRVDLVLRARAEVAFREGRNEEGVSWILDSLTFGDRIGRDTLIHNLIGFATQSYALNDVAPRLSKLSGSDLSKIERHARALLAERPAVVDAAEGERRFALSGKIDEINDELAVADDVAARIRSRVAGLSPEDRAWFERLLREKIEIQFGRIQQVLRGPESGWVQWSREGRPKEKPSLESVPELAAAQVGLSQPIWQTLASNPLTIRARLRLLILNTEVERYRLDHGRYPAVLESVVPHKDLADPLSGKSFEYRRLLRGYRLYSSGTKETGQVTLIRPRRKGS
jgi:hypothetical protein